MPFQVVVGDTTYSIPGNDINSQTNVLYHNGLPVCIDDVVNNSIQDSWSLFEYYRNHRIEARRVLGYTWREEVWFFFVNHNMYRIAEFLERLGLADCGWT